MNEKEKYSSKEIAEKFKEIYNLIMNGVVYQDKVRKFDIIDLYLMLGNITQSVNQYLTICLRNKYISKEVYDRIRFFERHYNDNRSKATYAVLKKMRYIYGDREITISEKDMIYNFMKEKGIPFTDVNFNVAVRDYALYGLDIPKPKKKTRTRKIDKK